MCVCQEIADPQFNDWWIGPAKGTAEWELLSCLWDAARLGNASLAAYILAGP